MLYNACVSAELVKVMIRDCSGATEETFENMVVNLYYACPLYLASLKGGGGYLFEF